MFQSAPDLIRALLPGSATATEEMRHTRLVQDWLAEGRQEGLEEGEARCEARGEARCEAKVTLRLLNRRCGPLTDTNTAQIIALLDFQGPADLAAWLAANT